MRIVLMDPRQKMVDSCVFKEVGVRGMSSYEQGEFWGFPWYLLESC